MYNLLLRFMLHL